MTARARIPVLLFAAAVAACAATARPPVLSEADAVSTTPAAREAATLAPQAFAEAERIRRKAAREHDDGDLASAQILGEHALAAYAHAFVLARLAKADKRLAESELALGKAKAELSALDEKQRFVLAEADDFEKRVRMLEDALPLVPNAQASPEREKARLEAARSMASQARLLCLSSRMLGDSKKELTDALAKLDALDTTLAKGAAPVPIDEAVRLRSVCLSQLTLVRRDKTRKAPAEGRADALLEELSRSGELLPFRDDRGVVVVLRGTQKELAERLTLLARVAKAHPEFPVLVVTHSAKGKPTADDDKRAQSIADALRQSGAPKVETHSAGGAQPVAGSPARNQRVEIVFVAPTS
jgi:outer membrane protein OmpA-like peptidoglycan-associated protein